MLTALDTPRLNLRPLTEADAPAVERILGDARVARMLRVVPHPFPPGAATEYLRRLGGGVTPEIALGVRRRGEPALLGAVSARRAGDGARLGYWLAPDAWGQGLMTEAVGAVVAALFDDGVAEIEAGVFADNPASRRILSRLGFAFGAAPETFNAARGVAVPYQQARLTAAQWRARPRPGAGEALESRS